MQFFTEKLQLQQCSFATLSFTQNVTLAIALWKYDALLIPSSGLLIYRMKMTISLSL